MGDRVSGNARGLRLRVFDHITVLNIVPLDLTEIAARSDELRNDCELLRRINHLTLAVEIGNTKTIGVEVASKPEVLLFLDEPTSGLDSGSAFNIIRSLRKLADAGQAILCTIHQPSAVLFEHFDELLLLKSGHSHQGLTRTNSY